MALIKADRVKESSTSTGASTFALAGAVTGFRSFSSVCSVGDTFYYVIDSDSGSEWETGLGTYSATNTLTRTTIHASSNSGSIVTFSAGTKNVYISLTGRQIDTVSAVPSASTGAPARILDLTGAAHTALTATTEYNDAYFNLSRTVQFATGNIPTQRAVRFSAPTYSFVAASTITDAATVQIDGAPVAGTNASFTNRMALRIVHTTGTKGIVLGCTYLWQGGSALEVQSDSGNKVFGIEAGLGSVVVGEGIHRLSSTQAQLSVTQTLTTGTAISISNSASSNTNDAMNIFNSLGAKVFNILGNGAINVAPSALSSGWVASQTITAPAHTALTASTEYSDIYWNLARTIQFSTGAIATQRAVRIAPPTYSFVAASTITTAATVQIDGAPVASTNATITNQISLRVLTGIATAKGLVVQGAASQSGNLQEWQNSAGTVLSAISSGGQVASTNIKETVFAITDGASVDINPANGGIQTWALGANRTPTASSFAEGQSVTLMIDDGTAYAITWSTISPTWVGGSAPTLATSGYTVIEMWKRSSTIYGALVGTA